MFKHLQHSIKKIRLKAFLPIFLLGVVFVTVPNVASADLGIQKFLYDMVVAIFGFFVGLAGSLLNTAINDFVIGFGDVYINKNLGANIEGLWVILRDFFNLTFIFGLVMIGLRMIFDSNNSSTRKMLISLILAALFVNFSLLITKLVVDFSNVAATQLVNQFEGGKISDAFINIMGGQGIYNNNNFNGMDSAAGLTFIFGTMVILIILCFVFLAGALLLFIRFALLNVYMLLSPLMFIGMVFPGAMGITRQYWSGFLNKAFFGPAYILMLYFSYVIIKDFGAIDSNTNLANALTTPNTSTMQDVFPPFIITAIFLIASIVIAQKMGMQGANGAIATGKMLTGKARKIALTPVRKTASYGAYAAAAAGEKLNNRLERTKLGRFAKGTVSALSLGSFTERDRRNAIEKGKNAKFGGRYSAKDDMDFSKKRQAERNQQAAIDKREADREKHEQDIADTSRSSADLEKSLDELGKVIKEMTAAEKEKLGIAKLTDKNYAVHLTDNDIDSLDKSGKYTAQEMKDIKDARNEGFRSIAMAGTTHTTGNSASGFTPASTAAGGVDQRAKLASRGPREVGKMPVEIFKDPSMLPHITPAMLEERMKNGMSDLDRRDIKSKLYTYLGGIPLTSTPKGYGTSSTNPWWKWEDGNSAFAAQFFS